MNNPMNEPEKKTTNPWIVAVNKTRLENPNISYKEALILTKTLYVNKEQKMIMKKSKKSKKSVLEEQVE